MSRSRAARAVAALALFAAVLAAGPGPAAADGHPSITSLTIISSPAVGEQYGLGEVIEVEAQFSAAVDVAADPAPEIVLRIGADSAGDRAAGYTRKSASDKVVFAYTVQSSDSDLDGISMGGGYQDDQGNWRNFNNHASITATGSAGADGNPRAASREFTGFSNQSGHLVNGAAGPANLTAEITSSPANGSVYLHGEAVEVALEFTVPLVVEGDRHIDLRFDSGYGDDHGIRQARYARGSGTDTLVFAYTVQTADRASIGAAVEGTYYNNGELRGAGGTGTIKAKGTDTAVEPTFPGLEEDSGHKVDGRPTPRAITIASTPEDGSDTYGQGEKVRISVRFGQSVTAAASAVALLRVDGAGSTAPRRAAYKSGNGTDTLIFEYAVAAGDVDEDGVDAEMPHGHQIKATGTEVLYSAGPLGKAVKMGENPQHKIDAAVAAVASVAVTSDPGTDSTYKIGDEIEVTVRFDEPITFTPPAAPDAADTPDGDDSGNDSDTGRPKINIKIGDNTRTAAYKGTSGSDGLEFAYTVAAGDSDADGISIEADKLSIADGGSIADADGNEADLAHAAVAAAAGHKVDGIAPAITTFGLISSAGDDNTYTNGDLIQIGAVFNEHITVTGSPQVTLTVGSNERTAAYAGTAGKSAIFAYTVAVGDSDTDGVSIAADSLALNGGTIQDAAGNPATLTHTAVAADTSHKVSAPGGL